MFNIKKKNKDDEKLVVKKTNFNPRDNSPGRRAEAIRSSENKFTDEEVRKLVLYAYANMPPSLRVLDEDKEVSVRRLLEHL